MRPLTFLPNQFYGQFILDKEIRLLTFFLQIIFIDRIRMVIARYKFMAKVIITVKYQ